MVSDGEMSKPSFLSYINERLGGVTITAEPFGNPWKGSRENKSFPEYYAWEASLNLNPAAGAKRVVCNGPLSYKGHQQVGADIATFKAALAKVKVREAFLPAISPSNVEFWIRNEHYKSEEEYIFALADVLHEEYRAITDAGLLLQIDDPRLVTQYVIDATMSLEDCRKWAELRVEALNRALRGIPEEQIRFHTAIRSIWARAPMTWSSRISSTSFSRSAPALIRSKELIPVTSTNGRYGAMSICPSTRF